MADADVDMGVTDPVAVGAAGEADGAATGAGGGGGGVGGASGSSKPQSALEENIVRKGKNSYYYAHASNLARDVDADAGKLLHASTDHAHAIGAPRLLHRGSVEELAEDAAARRRVRLAPVERYSWADFKKSVKVYVPHDEAESLPEEAVEVKSAEKSASLTIHAGETDLVLDLKKLNDKISGAELRRKPGKFVLVLKKVEEFKWYDLLSKAD